jgi:hypothetical protein
LLWPTKDRFSKFCVQNTPAYRRGVYFDLIVGVTILK